MNADLLISMVLNEGRKIPLRPHVGGRRIPKFGRKARRFGSKAPLQDKGGELSVVDRFGVSPGVYRPHQQYTNQDPITHFGPPSRSKEVNDRHNALVHLTHHIGRRSKPDSGISDDEYSEMNHHRERLIKAEAVRVVNGLHRMLMKSGSLNNGEDPVHIKPKVKIPDSASEKDFEKAVDKGGSNFNQIQVGLSTRLHDVGEHGFLGVLPTRRGEMMAGVFRRMSQVYSLYNIPKNVWRVDKEASLRDAEYLIRDLYDNAHRENALPVREHDHRKVIEFARTLKGGGPRMPTV